MKKLKITERGYAGHFCASSLCRFKRNTLIEYGNKRIVVSTVGNYNPPKIGLEKLDKSKKIHEIGINRTYETMAFEAQFIKPYWEADVTKEIPFKSNWALSELEHGTDLLADEMHDKVVKELSKKIVK